MIRILLKEPVGGGIYGKEDGIAARQTFTLEVKGNIDEDTLKKFDSVLVDRGAMLFVAVDGRNVLIPSDNISYMIEGKHE